MGGTLRWPDGRSYSGQWCDGQQHGKATACTPRGLKRESWWEHGKFVQWMDGVAEEGQSLNSGGEKEAGTADAIDAKVVDVGGNLDANVLNGLASAEEPSVGTTVAQYPTDAMPVPCNPEDAGVRISAQ